MQTAICSKCKAEKPVGAFFWDARYQRPRTVCKTCFPRAGGKRTPLQRAQWRREHGICAGEYITRAMEIERVQACAVERERKAALRKQPQHDAHVKAWRYWCKCERYRLKYQSDPDWAKVERERQRIYKHAHVERVARWGNRRSKRMAAQSDGTATSEAIANLLASSTVCPYCLENMAREEKSIDHIIPVSRGGLHGLRNLVVCHLRCNLMKRARTPDEMRAGPSEGGGGIAGIARARCSSSFRGLKFG